MQKLAPIALFVFKRPQHTRQALESLARNPEFLDSPLFIYCDGPRNDVEAAATDVTRQVVHDWPHPNKTIISRNRNFGLANSLISGVTESCEQFGRVIVVEDDLVVSPVFLHYLNGALEHFANDAKVMQISAHMFPVEVDCTSEAVMLPFTTSWGWATWSRAWKYFDPTLSGFETLRRDSALRHRFNLNGSYPYYRMLKRQATGRIDSWAIRWYTSVFFEGGLTLYPRHSLVRNDGYGRGATHSVRNNRKEVANVYDSPVTKFPPSCVENEVARKVYQFLASETSVLRWIATRLKK